MTKAAQCAQAKNNILMVQEKFQKAVPLGAAQRKAQPSGFEISFKSTALVNMTKPAEINVTKPDKPQPARF